MNRFDDADQVFRERLGSAMVLAVVGAEGPTGARAVKAAVQRGVLKTSDGDRILVQLARVAFGQSGRLELPRHKVLPLGDLGGCVVWYTGETAAAKRGVNGPEGFPARRGLTYGVVYGRNGHLLEVAEGEDARGVGSVGATVVFIPYGIVEYLE